MALYFGNTKIEKIIKDGTEIKDFIYGNTKVFKKRQFSSNFVFRKRWSTSISEPSTPPLYIMFYINGTLKDSVTINSGDYNSGAVWEEQASTYRSFYNKIVTANKSINFTFLANDDSDYYTVKYRFDSGWNDSSTAFQLMTDAIFNDSNNTYRKEISITSPNLVITMYPLSDNVNISFYASQTSHPQKLFANTSPVNIPITGGIA
jgi:hypothetical protein